MYKLSRWVFTCIMTAFLFMIAGKGWAATAADDIPATDTAARGVELLKKIEDKYRDTKTFFGRFEQVKISELFLEEIHSEGEFWYRKPGLFRCEYLPPNAQVNLIIENKAYVYIPEIKQVEIYHFKNEDSPVKKLNHMLLGFGVSVKDVLDVYDVFSIPGEETEDSFALLFKLRKMEEGFNFESIRIWFKKKSLLPFRLAFQEPGTSDAPGDRTEIDLKKVEFNNKIKPSVFEPVFPKDAEVIEQN